MSSVPVSVVNLANNSEDALHQAQTRIEGELKAGRDVMVVCESDPPGREERLLLCRPAITFVSAKLAIVVSGNVKTAEQAMPASTTGRVRFFGSMEAGMNWLRPRMAAAKKTLRYVTVK